MGNFNLKSIWKQTGGTGGSTNLEQRVQAIENGYFKKEGGTHQIVRNSADFFANIVLKQNGYVDHVDTNGPTSMINKQYLEQQLTATKNQIRTENNTFTGTNTFNNAVSINSAGNDFTWETTRNWNQNLDNTVARTKDFKFVRQIEYTSNITQPNNQWNKTSWNWNWSGINTEGLHEVLVIVSIENIPYSLNAKLVWKNGVSDSISPLLIVEHGDTTFHFQLVIKSNNKFHIYNKKIAGTKNIQWVRIWFVRGVNLPWKMNQIW